MQTWVLFFKVPERTTTFEMLTLTHSAQNEKFKKQQPKISPHMHEAELWFYSVLK